MSTPKSHLQAQISDRDSMQVNGRKMFSGEMVAFFRLKKSICKSCVVQLIIFDLGNHNQSRKRKMVHRYICDCMKLNLAGFSKFPSPLVNLQNILPVWDDLSVSIRWLVGYFHWCRFFFRIVNNGLSTSTLVDIGHPFIYLYVIARIFVSKQFCVQRRFL